MRHFSTIDSYKQRCHSDYPLEVIACMQTLGEISPEHLHDVLPAALNHSSLDVQIAAVRTIGKYQLSSYRQELEELRQTNKVPSLQAAVILSLCALQTNKDFSWCLAYLADESLPMREAAIIALIKYAPVPAAKLAKQRLEEMVASGHKEEMLSAAQIIASTEDPGLQSFLQPLIIYWDADVRRKAIEAVGMIHASTFFPALVEGLSVPTLKNTAAKAIVHLDENILSYLGGNFSHYSVDLKITLAKLFGMMSKKAAVAVLLSNINEKNDQVMAAILESLDKLLYQPAHKNEENVLEDEIRKSLDRIEFLLEIYQQLPVNQPAIDPLKDIINGHIQIIWRQIFFALGCRYSREVIHKIMTAIMTASEDQKSYAQELLQVTLNKLHAKSILPLLVETLYKINYQSAATKEKKDPVILFQSLLDYPASSFLLIKLATIYVIAQMQLVAFKNELQVLAEDENPLMRETALWGLGRLS